MTLEYSKSNCCGALVTETGFCTDCKEHAEPTYSCDDCDTEITKTEAKEYGGLCEQCMWLLDK